jgi:site-specific DNA recombinase
MGSAALCSFNVLSISSRPNSGLVGADPLVFGVPPLLGGVAERDVLDVEQDFGHAQAVLAGRGSKTQHKQHSRPRAYSLRGVLHCGLCGRKMSAQMNNEQVYYRCRFPAEYALANRVDHPKTVYVREADVLGHVDDWLAELFAAEAIEETVTQLAEQAGQLEDPAAQARALAALARVADFDAQMTRYRASIDAGGDPAVIGPWIAETQAKKVAAQAEIRAATGQRQMTRDETEAVATALGVLARVVQAADPADKADIYAKLRLTLTYQPEEKLVQATIKTGLDMCKGFVSEAGLGQCAHVLTNRARLAVV